MDYNDIVVRDAKGNPVYDITEKAIDNGQEQKIMNLNRGMLSIPTQITMELMNLILLCYDYNLALWVALAH